MLLLIVLAAFTHPSSQQCLTANDEVRNLSSAAHVSLLRSELQFSTDLLRSAASLHPEANLIISPASVFQASLLVYFISASKTEQSLRKLLRLADNNDKLDVFGAYNMEKYYQKLCALKSRQYQLSSANRFYVDKNLKIRNCMKVLFADEIHQGNFMENSKGVEKKINDWVASQTRNEITNLLHEGTISGNTELVLVNTAYFKGKWASPFKESKTFDGKFRLSNGSHVISRMMRQLGDFRHDLNKRLGAEVLELPYVGEDISMYIILPVKPSPTAVQDLLKKLDGKALQSLVRSLTASYPFEFKVVIPKFTVESSLNLIPILESFEAGDLFHGSSDLSTLAPGLSSVSEAVHKAKIQVDEKGTVAAAATYYVVALSDDEPLRFIADHPFLYTIYNKATNIPLFFGVFNHPEPKDS